ncbi:MAG: DUF1579 family protein [Ignavibacteriaceae bacterium]
MQEIINPLDKLNFLIGRWQLKYEIPKSIFSEQDKGEGTGEFKKVLNDNYVTFNYNAKLKSSETSAEGIFAWDDKSKLYRYWWFEDSGNFSSATCNFINDETLCLNWHDGLMVQSFKKESDDTVILRMMYPSGENQYNTVLKVTLIREE